MKKSDFFPRRPCCIFLFAMYITPIYYDCIFRKVRIIMFIPDTSLGASLRRSTPGDDDFILLFSGRQALLSAGGMTPPRFGDLRGLIPPETSFLHAGTLEGKHCFVCDVPALPAELPPEFQLTAARRILADASGGLPELLCRGRELLYWVRRHRFCGACRTELTPSDTDSGLICPACAARYYPEIAPAVITAILRNGPSGREILLGHNRKFEDGVYSLIAGFVEAGESAEHAVVREIGEETGIRVKELRYVSSQPWPFPNSLMLGFTAEYDSGEPVPDGTELTSLKWFPLTALPKIPDRGSIARAILDMLRGKQEVPHGG